MKLLNLFLCLVVLVFSQAVSAQNIKTTTQKFETNTVSIIAQIDTIAVMDPVTSEEFIRFEKKEWVKTLNFKEVYYNKDASEPVGAAAQSTLNDFIGNMIKDELKNAENVHSIDIVIDEKGGLGFIRFQFLKDGKDAEKETAPLRERIIEKLKGVHFIPARHNGKAVPYGTAIMVIK